MRAARRRATTRATQIGDWKIVSVDNQYVVFEWDGKQFKKRIDELMDRSGLAAETAQRQLPPPLPTRRLPPRRKVCRIPSKSDHWVDVGADDMRGCKPGDDSAPGTVVDGFKKVVSSTPFGNACRWEQVK